MSDTTYLQPIGIDREEVPGCLPLAGGPLRFSGVIVARRRAGSVERQAVALDRLPAELQPTLGAITAARPAIAGIAMDRPHVMGVVNVTPDSFSDGGDRFDAGRAVSDGSALWEAGAVVVDVGGESTRPGAEPVPVEEELRRVLPVVRGLADAGVRVSIDTRRARVMAEALAAGAVIVNDVTALTGDPESLPLLAKADCPVILMHMLGDPRTMQLDPRYADVTLDIFDYLAARITACEAAGVARERLVIDPGIGFGKSVQHNLDLLSRLASFHQLGCPLVLGVSRKSFIGRLSRGEGPKQRLPGSIAASLAGAERGAQFLRVHDVAEMVQALAVWQALSQNPVSQNPVA